MIVEQPYSVTINVCRNQQTGEEYLTVQGHRLDIPMVPGARIRLERREDGSLTVMADAPDKRERQFFPPMLRAEVELSPPYQPMPAYDLDGNLVPAAMVR